MEKFNAYQYLRDLERELILQINAGNIENFDDIQDYIYTDINNACIYYSDCFDICKELNATDFSAYDLECTNICQLAYCCLDEFIRENLDYNELEELINAKVNA
jgi:hypothetical protein